MKSKVVCLIAPMLLSVAAGCSCFGGPEVRGINVQIGSIDFSGIGVVFNVDVHNPYPVRLKTPKFRYGIDIAQTAFVQSEHPTEIDLPASGVGTVPLPVRMEYAKLWKAFENLKGANEIPYRLHGAIVVTALDRPWELPLEHKGTLPILRPPSFSAPRVRVGEVSLNSAKVVVDVDVHNPNACGIGLGNVGYNVALGKIPIGSIRASTLGELAGKATGKLSLSGEVTAAAALVQLARGQSLGEPTLTCSGAIQTPYGSVPVPPGLMGIGR